MKKSTVILLGVLIIFITIAAVFSGVINGKAAVAKASIEMKSTKEVVSKLNSNNGSEKIKIIVNYDNSDKKGFGVKSLDKKSESISKDLVAIEVNLSELGEIASNEKVKKISLNHKFEVDLQEAVGIVNATASWPIEISGWNITGTNQTICIIDTGVNYSHPDLGGCYGNNDPSDSCKVIGGYDFFNEDWNPMDDNGHGTHVAGIAAARGNITGIAPNAKIIAMKVLDETGSGYESDLIRGIDWCVGNASRYNIVAISMSLGTNCYNETDDWTGWCYNNYCDGDYSDFADSINAAVAKNISVLAASGNDGESAYISSPACIENATPVGSTTKADAIASYSNRNSLVKLFAPGSSINSTEFSTAPICSEPGVSCNGNYAVISGTSMATPNAAGAVALVKEYLSISGQTKTPNDIEDLLNSTGKRIGVTNYTRINIWGALRSIDRTAPEVTLTNPDKSQEINTNGNMTFRCYSNDINLKNVTFYLWNTTSSLINSTNMTISGTNFAYEVNLTSLARSDYEWNCLFFDQNNYSAFASANWTVTHDSISPEINILYPGDGSWQKRGEFNVSLNEPGNCTYQINSGRNVSMSSIDGYNFTAINETLVQDMEYNLTFYCNDSSGNSAITNATRFTIDQTTPNVTSIGPDNGYSANGTTTVSFSYNVTDNLNMTKCELIMDNVSRAENSSRVITGNDTNTISYSVSPGNYSWQINCTDVAGNVGNDGSRSLTINSLPEEPRRSGGGGGGGGSATQTLSLTDEQIATGVTESLGAGDKISFNSHSNGHTLTINKIISQSVNLTVSSDPINLVLIPGQEIKLNISSENYYDIYIKLEGITGNKANLTIRQIYEAIDLVGGIGGETVESNKSGHRFVAMDSAETESWKDYIYPVIYFVAGAVIVVLVVYFGLKISTNSKNKR